MSMSIKTTLPRFPEQEVIISYLKQHPCTKDAYFEDTKIIETVAKVFAKKEKTIVGIEFNVLAQMAKINSDQHLHLHPETNHIITENLSQALCDCANGIKIEDLKKRMETDKKENATSTNTSDPKSRLTPPPF